MYDPPFVGTSLNFVPQPPDLPSEVTAMVWLLDSQKADHYGGSEGEDRGNIIVVAETAMVVDGSGYGVVDANDGVV